MSQWDQSSWISDGFAWWMVLIILAVYALPSLIALLRDHPHKKPIFILNLLAGWTGIFWIGALVWSFYSVDGPMKLLKR